MFKERNKDWLEKALLIMLFTGGILFPLNCFSQKSDFNFVLEKIKVDYPGYRSKIKHIDLDKFAYKTLKENNNDTFKALSIVLDFFNDQHFKVYTSRNRLVIDSNRCRDNFNKVNKLFESHDFKRREGFWLNEDNNCVIAIRNISKKPLRYIATVIEEHEGNLVPGMEMNMQQVNDDNFFMDYFGTYSGKRSFLRSSFRNDSILTTGSFGKWKKLRNYNYRNPILHKLVRPNDKATGRLFDRDNYIITIPDCSGSNVKRVDSIVRADSVVISHTKNLIVDIRNNLGGKSKAFEPLLPFIYTNPIIRPCAYTYCSEGYAQELTRELNSYLNSGVIDSETVNDFKTDIRMVRDSIGKFILYPSDTVRFASIQKNPKNVAVVMNYACESAAELLILTFKQSKKVTLFGEHTAGAVDYLDVYSEDVPSGKYKLYIPTSKRYIPQNEQSIDGVGIYPQVPISDIEPDWIQFVMRYYEKN